MPLNIKDLRIAALQFGFDERIPDAHAADFGNVPPDLEISGVPAGAAELAVIVHDPDAPLPNGFTHWVVYGIAPTTTQIGSTDGDELYRQGPNSLGEDSYFGPQPPPSHGVHHYYFWVYAMDVPVVGNPSREEFLARYGDNIIEQNRLVGTYST